MLIFGLNLSSRRKKRFPGIDDVIVALGCTYKWSKLELADATSQGCSTHKNKTSCEGIRSLALKKAPEPWKKLGYQFRPNASVSWFGGSGEEQVQKGL